MTSYLAPDSDEEETRPTMHLYREFEIRPDRRVSARTAIITAGDVLEPPPVPDSIPCDESTLTEPPLLDPADTYHEGIQIQEDMEGSSNRRERGSSVCFTSNV